MKTYAHDMCYSNLRELIVRITSGFYDANKGTKFALNIDSGRRVDPSMRYILFNRRILGKNVTIAMTSTFQKYCTISSVAETKLVDWFVKQIEKADRRSESRSPISMRSRDSDYDDERWTLEACADKKEYGYDINGFVIPDGCMHRDRTRV